MCDTGGPRLSRPPACPWRPRGRLRVHVAPGTSRPTMCDTGGPRLSRPSRRCPSLERGCFAYAVLAKTDVATTPGIPGYATIGLCQGSGTGTGEEARSVVGADVLGRPRVRGVPAGAFAYTARRGRRALPCATREGRACRGRLVGVRLWNADASHTQFWQRPMWLRRPEYRATPQSVFAKVQGREPARRRGAW